MTRRPTTEAMPIIEAMRAALVGVAPRSRNIGIRCTTMPPMPSAIVSASADMHQKAVVLPAARMVSPVAAGAEAAAMASRRSAGLKPR
jgi:hypothetical protein